MNMKMLRNNKDFLQKPAIGHFPTKRWNYACSLISRRRRMALLTVTAAVVEWVQAPPAIVLRHPLQCQIPTTWRANEPYSKWNILTSHSIPLPSHSHSNSISFPFHSQLIPIAFPSHSNSNSISFPFQHIHIPFSFHSHLIPFPFPSSSLSFSHLIPISFSSHSHS